MTRPRHGLSVVEALERWSDPEAWAEVEALFDSHDVSSTPYGKRFGPKLRATAAFERVCEEFGRMLRESELIVSATLEHPDPSNPRFVVDPDLMRSLIIRMDLNQIIGPGVKLCSPEIFKPEAIPLNVREIPPWLSELAREATTTPAAQSASTSVAETGGRRPLRGLSIEEALQRWSDPSEWAAMNTLSDAARPVSAGVGQPPTAAVLRHQEYCRRREPLERELLRKLRQGELIASATDERPGPTDPRFVVSPETFDRVGFEWDWPDVMTGIGISIHNVEIFSSDEVPLNIDPKDLPRWLRPPQEVKVPTPAPAAQGAQPEFRHDADYSHVWLRGREYSLTAKQARVVEVLHDAYLNRASAWMKLEEIRAEVDFESASLHQLFRRMRHWKELIRSDGRGAYRLNIGDFPQDW